VPSQFQKKSDSRSNKNNRLRLTIIVSVIVLVLIIGAVWFLIQRTQNEASTTTKEVQLSDINVAVQQGDIDGSLQKIETLQSKATTDSQKVTLLQTKFNIQSNAGKNEDALETALKLVEIEQTEEVYSTVGLAYEKAGDKQKAIENYKKALALLEGRTDKGNLTEYFSDRQYYQVRIGTLEG
jgi:tetratricopeptide (TPR) repeat protein